MRVAGGAERREKGQRANGQRHGTTSLHRMAKLTGLVTWNVVRMWSDQNSLSLQVTVQMISATSKNWQYTLRLSSSTLGYILKGNKCLCPLKLGMRTFISTFIQNRWRHLSKLTELHT